MAPNVFPSSSRPPDRAAYLAAAGKCRGAAKTSPAAFRSSVKTRHSVKLDFAEQRILAFPGAQPIRPPNTCCTATEHRQNPSVTVPADEISRMKPQDLPSMRHLTGFFTRTKGWEAELLLRCTDRGPAPRDLSSGPEDAGVCTAPRAR